MLGIYTRLSVKDEDSNSIQNQIRESKEFAKIKGFQDFLIYNEGAGVSGSLDIEDRPQLLGLMNDIKSGLITTVWFRNQNRLERNSLTYANFVATVKALKCDVYFGFEHQDFNNPNSALQGHILTGLNQYQRELQSIQTKKSLKDNAKEGKTHGISPYGYTKDKNSYIIIDEEEAVIVKRIYEMSLSGKGTNKIAEIFNKENIPTRYNKIGKGTITTKYNGKVKTTQKKDIKWSGNTIRNIIKNPMYKGERHLKSGVYKCENIITSNQWQKAQDNLIVNRNTNGKIYKHNYLLKDLIECNKCERNYYGKTRISKKDHYYMCSSKRYKDKNCGNRSINIDVIEYFIWQRFFADKILKDIIQNHFKNTSTEDRKTSIQGEINQCNDSLAIIKRKQSKAIKLVLDGVLTDEDLKSEITILKNDKNIYENKLNKLNKEFKALDNINEDVFNMVNELKQIKQNATFDEKRHIIKKYISYIDLLYSKGFYLIRIYFNVFDLNPENEVYFIDRNYNLCFELCNNLVMPLSDKFKKMNNAELTQIANSYYSAWAENTN